jgi:hypothetical protein
MRTDALDELVGLDSPGDALIISGALSSAMFDCGNREALSILDEIYVFAKEKMG